MTAKFEDGDEQEYSTASRSIAKELLHYTANPDELV